MSWRAGARLFREIWPLIEAHEPPGEFREEFLLGLLDLFLGSDVDSNDLIGLHPEVDHALEIIAARPVDLDGLGLEED